MVETVEREAYDIIVVGGGIAGVSAAVAAARSGKKVFLMEKSVNLGGLATNGLISWYEPLCDGQGKQMIFGLAEELIQLSVKYCFDNLPVCWGGSNEEKKRYATSFSPTVFSLALDRFVVENGAKIRFDTYATYPVMEKQHCTGVICESANGREFFPATVIIDATGDASICHRAGMPTVVGENYMSYIAHYYDNDVIRAYMESGSTCNFRKWMNSGSDLAGNGHPKGLGMLKGDTAEDITEYLLYGKKQMLERIKSRDKNSFDIMALPAMPQFRKIRRIAGAADFEAVDGLEFADFIGDCGDFRPCGVGKHYQIPYRALYHPEFDNILACGRIISAPEGDGWEVARVIPVCALTGEAAGKAAAKAIDDGIAVTEVKYKELRER